MSHAVDWPARMREGFALAAAAHGDRGGERAAAGLVPRIAPAAREVAVRIAASDRAARRAWVQATLTERLALSEPPGRCPPRALSLLALSAPRELGRRWMASAPLPRPGYAPAPGLIALLRALVAARCPEDPT
jgi:hypothetical protein